MNNNCKITSSQLSNELNERIYDRNIPSGPLQPYIDVRPVMTKYSIMPIVDPRAPIKSPMVQMPTYNIENTFNPGNTQSPWSGFATNINTESELRNQVFALQKCSQSKYVPSSSSNLYINTIPQQGNISQPFPELFRKEKFQSFDPNCENVGKNIFNNYTRMQLRVPLNK